MARSHRPNWLVLPIMQKYSTRAWVYREGQGWIFAELTADELAEFKSYDYSITIPRMRVRLPHSQVIRFLHSVPDNVTNWFAFCTMPQASPLVQIGFQIQQMTDKPKGYTRYPIEAGSYEAWLWADEVTICRELGCNITVHHGWCWREWGVPAEWRPPITGRPRYKERSSIYALFDEFTQEVGYVGEGENPHLRYKAHLRVRDTENQAKWAWIQRLRREGRKPGLRILEENVAGENALERENYWKKHYWELGHSLTNAACRNWPKPDVLCHVSLPLD